MTELTTTLNRIREHGPCCEGWETLLKGLGKTSPDDEPLPYARIVEINGLDDAIWCCRAEPKYDRQWRLYAVWCARRVQHLTTDPRSVAALDVAERYARGEASDEELAAARDAAGDAWAAARDAWAAARDAWDVARDAWDAAEKTTWAAARDAACAAAGAAWAARAAAWDATRDAARDAQRVEFLRVVNGGEQ